MALLIEKEEAFKLLRANVKHYLWNKHFSRWTEADVENLRNGINKNFGNILRAKAPRNSKPYYKKQMEFETDNYTGGSKGQPVLVTTKDGQSLKFDSVIKAHEGTGVPASNIYALLNGRYAQSHGFNFKKL